MQRPRVSYLTPLVLLMIGCPKDPGSEADSIAETDSGSEAESDSEADSEADSSSEADSESASDSDSDSGSDGPPPGECDPLDAQSGDDCRARQLFSWNGEKCSLLECGCVGEDCDFVWTSAADCFHAHEPCLADQLTTCAPLELSMDATLVGTTAIGDEVYAAGAFGLYDGNVRIFLAIDPDTIYTHEFTIWGEFGWASFPTLMIIQGDIDPAPGTYPVTVDVPLSDVSTQIDGSLTIESIAVEGSPETWQLAAFLEVEGPDGEGNVWDVHDAFATGGCGFMNWP